MKTNINKLISDIKSKGIILYGEYDDGRVTSQKINHNLFFTDNEGLEFCFMGDFNAYRDIETISATHLNPPELIQGDLKTYVLIREVWDEDDKINLSKDKLNALSTAIEQSIILE